jgi:transposase InsO family protein
MTWKVSSAMSERLEFVTLILAAEEQGLKLNMQDLCSRFQISRKTGYKWLNRFKESGCKVMALEDLSRRPVSSPNRTCTEMEALVLALRLKHPYWGARKLRALMQMMGYDEDSLPAVSTITSILHRHGMISEEESEKREHPHRFEHPLPNDLWQMDYKGYFHLENGKRCHPLTVLDDHSRYLVGLVACPNEEAGTTKEALTPIFRRYGLPFRMTMDNGSPWGHIANQGSRLGERRYTAFELWLMRLGIKVSHSTPFHPQTQGKDERLHRTLKLELLSDYNWRDLEGCQPEFDSWRTGYNCERPHEALGMKVPAERYQPSGRPFPETLPPLEYDAGDEVRKVNDRGMVKYKKQLYFLGHAFCGELVGLRPQQQVDGVWDVYYGRHKVATLNFNKVLPMSPNTCV